MNYRILHYQTVDSTNHLARLFAEKNAAEGTVVKAEYQTKGRGRFHRRWHAPRGKGLLCSVILRPLLKPSQAAILTHLGALAVAQMLKRKFDLPAKLKRPNDVLVENRKICGILTESTTGGKYVDYAVMGIGLNVNMKKSETAAGGTSILIETGKKTEIGEVLKEVLFRLDELYAKACPKQMEVEP